MRRAACERSSLQLRTAAGAGSLPLVGVATGAGVLVVDRAGAGAGAGLEQAASSVATANTFSFDRQSMQRTVDLLGQIMRHPFDSREVFDARTRHAAHAAETLQQLGAFLGTDPGDVFEPAPARAHTRAARAHAGDREAVRLVANLRHEHQRRRIATEVDLLAAVGEHQLFEADLAPLALLDANDQPE